MCASNKSSLYNSKRLKSKPSLGEQGDAGNILCFSKLLIEFVQSLYSTSYFPKSNS